MYSNIDWDIKKMKKVEPTCSSSLLKKTRRVILHSRKHAAIELTGRLIEIIISIHVSYDILLIRQSTMWTWNGWKMPTVNLYIWSVKFVIVYVQVLARDVARLSAGIIKTLRPIKKYPQFADDISKCIFKWFQCRLRFHWNLSLMCELTIYQH